MRREDERTTCPASLWAFIRSSHMASFIISPVYSITNEPFLMSPSLREPICVAKREEQRGSKILTGGIRLACEYK